ncbi:9307_t:CDS:2, partial [Paraglomus brasilianum]
VGYPQGVYNRNTSLHTSTRRYRPDLSYLALDACLARGEEKGPDNDDDPGEELVSKLTWTYGNCPYIFGYHAKCATVTYCYLYTEGEEIKRKDLITVNLNELEGRLQAFAIGRNIGRLLPLLRQTLPGYFQREFTILHRSGGKVVEFMQAVVVKRYPEVAFVNNLKAYYDIMAKNQVPFIDRLVHINTEEGKTPFVILSPKGMVHKPQSLEKLIIALYCVLTALKSLHSLKIMHRDIRWENVLKNIEKDRWFIIDFDDACSSPSSIPHNALAYESHAPEIFTGVHDTSVDIWSVGYLILTTSVKHEPLIDYAKKMMAKNYLERPTAHESLQWLWSNFEDVLKGEVL